MSVVTFQLYERLNMVSSKDVVFTIKRKNDTFKQYQ